MKEINDLVDKVKCKDKLAVKFLYTTYVKEMLTLSYRITNNFKDAEDIIQESFLASFQKINQLKEPKNYSFWLKRIVINNSLKSVKDNLYFEQINDDTFVQNL